MLHLRVFQTYIHAISYNVIKYVWVCKIFVRFSSFPIGNAWCVMCVCVCGRTKKINDNDCLMSCNAGNFQTLSSDVSVPTELHVNNFCNNFAFNYFLSSLFPSSLSSLFPLLCISVEKNNQECSFMYFFSTIMLSWQ